MRADCSRIGSEVCSDAWVCGEYTLSTDTEGFDIAKAVRVPSEAWMLCSVDWSGFFCLNISTGSTDGCSGYTDVALGLTEGCGAPEVACSGRTEGFDGSSTGALFGWPHPFPPAIGVQAGSVPATQSVIGGDVVPFLCVL